MAGDSHAIPILSRETLTFVVNDCEVPVAKMRKCGGIYALIARICLY